MLTTSVRMHNFSTGCSKEFHADAVFSTPPAQLAILHPHGHLSAGRWIPIFLRSEDLRMDRRQRRRLRHIHRLVACWRPWSERRRKVQPQRRLYGVADSESAGEVNAGSTWRGGVARYGDSRRRPDIRVGRRAGQSQCRADVEPGQWFVRSRLDTQHQRRYDRSRLALSEFRHRTE